MSREPRSPRSPAEKPPRASQATCPTIAASIPGIVYQLKVNPDRSVSFPYISQGVRRILGYTITEIRRDPAAFLESLLANSSYSQARLIQAVQGARKTQSLELKITLKNGETRWVRNTATPVSRDSGAVLWNGVVIDITEQVTAQEARRRSEQHYREVFDHTSDAVFIVDVTPGGSFRYNSYNAAAAEVIGQQAHSVPGNLVEDYFTPAVAQALIDNYRQCLQAGAPISYKELFTLPAGPRYFYTTLAPVPDETGRIYRIIGIAHDFTERETAENAVRESEEKYRSLVGNLKLGIFRSTAAGQHLEVNRAMTEITGYSRSELLAMNVADLYENPVERPRFLEQLISAPHPESQEIRNRRKDGRPIVVAATITPVVNAGGQVVYYDGILEDITQRKKLEEQLKELYQKEKQERRELEEEARLRSLFIDVLAHELRTPLTPVLSSVEMLRELPAGQNNEIRNKLIENICNSTRILADRLEELLDLARQARGSFKLNLQPEDLDRFVRLVLTRFRPFIEHRRQELVEEIASGLPIAEIDASRLEQVIINLLSNASKFSPEHATILFRGGLKERFFEVAVQDHGIGIPAEAQSQLFQPYHRVVQDRQYPGLGLGLAVAKQIIEAHGGQIRLVSQPGQGSTFSFRIPLVTPGTMVRELT